MSSVVGVTAIYAARARGNRDLFLHTKEVRVRLMYMTYFLCDGVGNRDSDFVHIERSQLMVTGFNGGQSGSHFDWRKTREILGEFAFDDLS